MELPSHMCGHFFLYTPCHWNFRHIFYRIIHVKSTFPKSIIQKLYSLLKAVFGIVRPHDHCNQFHTIFFSRSRHAESRIACRSCLKSGCISILSDQLVGICKPEFWCPFSGHMCDCIHPYHGILMNLRIMNDQFSWHQCNVSGCRLMSICVQTITIYKMRIHHTKSLSPLIHLLHKCFLTATDILSHGNTSVIRTCHGNAFNQRIYRLCLTRLQKHLWSPHGRRILRRLHVIL